VKPLPRYLVWTLITVVVLGGLAARKILPLHATAQPRDHAARDTTSAAGPQKQGSGAALKVATFVVRPMPFAETVNSTGTLRADEGVELQAETNGKIVAINFTEGSRVREGELLVKLNDSDLRATLTRATYRKQLAQLRERRLSQLLGQKVVTQNDYDTALSDMNVQDAEIALVQAQIEKTEIRAPFDGVVGLRYVSTGAYVNATTRIATVQRLDRLKIDFALPEKYIGRLKVGSPVTFTVAGGEGRIKGEIYAFDPRIDTGTRTLLIRAVCRNQEGRLLPGTFANVELTLTELRAAVLIPSEAVIPGVNEKNVFVMNDGKAERRVVETGTRMASTVHILAGLSPGDVVITSGLLQMRIGQPVVALEAPPGPPAAQPTNTATAQSTNKPTAKSTAGVRAAAQL
jgi:membrane fusion protein (multidrug efflux system)